ncbi:tryptophan halogenase family protein [Catenulispora yoronensis]
MGAEDHSRNGAANRLDTAIDLLDPPDAEAVRAWLSPARNGGGVHPGALTAILEPVGRDLRRPSPDDPAAVRTVGVIGGGTAGYLMALALRVKRPWLDVCLVESKDIPIIGVGEASVTEMLWFLHCYLGIDPVEFYQEVRPTWKLGIKFDWGPDPSGFTAPFDWASHPVGMLGALADTGSVDGFSIGSLLMMADKAPVLNLGGEPVSLMKYLPCAYHLENVRFVRYLTAVAERRGVRHVDATVAEVVLGGDGWVDHLRTTDSRDLRYDLYIDCTGFRSRLLGQALGVPFESYADSLFTDSAVTGNRDHQGHLKPYTTATTMNAGWCWTIPVPENDHHGYVYDSSEISDQQAAEELRTRFPGISDPVYVRFKSGRRSQVWRGNVMAVGNSYGFVEPLESTGLAMATIAIRTFVSVLPASWDEPLARDAVNASLNGQWDALRWFLAVHYRFNTRLDTPFWKRARAATDVSGLQPLLDVFATGAPLARRQGFVRSMLMQATPPFYGLAGVDNILLGQAVPTELVSTAEPLERWRTRRDAAEALLRHAMPHADALQAFADDPGLITELFQDEDSWLGPTRARLLET